MLRIDGRDIPYGLVRSARARRVRLRIGTEPLVEIVAPVGLRLGSLESLLVPHRRWIFKHLDAIDRLKKEKWQAVSGALLPYLGVDYVLEFRETVGRPEVVVIAHSLLVHASDTSAKYVAAVLEGWYRDRARVVITEHMQCWAKRMGLKHGRLSIKGQSSRWGSCSSHGNFNFNWRLMMAPLPVLEYVVIHELAHLSVPDHSSRFWELVERYCPERREHQKWLREHGPRLAEILPRD